MAEPPTGVVTFLFTDVEGSTRLVKQLRERYGAVLADHQRLLRAAFDAHGGYEVDTQGDSFFVAFPSARAAVLAAVDGQRALLSHAWPVGVEVKVRMGLHTGQAVAHDGRYTGLAVHRAARIGAAGHGGQVLLSQATQTLLEDEEEDLEVSLRDLGEQQLKDLDRPVRLFQAAADGLAETFPPVRGQADVSAAGEAALAPVPLWRRPAALVVAALAVAALVAVAVVLVTRDSSGGLDAIQANHVGLIDPETNEIVAEVPVGIRPGPIAAGEGSVWVGNLEDQSLNQIDPDQRSRTATISLEGGTPTGIAVGLGAVWIAHGFRGGVSRVDPAFGEPSPAIAVGGTAFGSPYGSIDVGEDSVWTAFGDSTLARLDAAGEVLGETLAGSQTAGIVVSGDSVWVSNAGDATVQRFASETFRQGALDTFNIGSLPAGIVYADDAIWVACSGDDVVWRIDPDSRATLQIPVGDGPSVLAAAADAIWVGNAGVGTVSRIDVETNKVVKTIDIGNLPAGIAAAGGFVWVTSQEP